MGILYIVATPIGNLEDITLRALRILKEVPLIAAEDTRHTRQLLTHFDIHTPLTSYFEHNKLQKLDQIRAALEKGDVALVSDAGTPTINDPGYELIKYVLEAGFQVCPIPGPSSTITALSASGLPTDTFLFLGYLPRKTSDRRALFEKVKPHQYTLIFLESPNRLISSLKEMLITLGDRRIAIGRELTKKFEEIIRGSVTEVITKLGVEPRGEIVIIVEGEKDQQEQLISDEKLRMMIRNDLQSGKPVKLIATELAELTSLDKRTIYQLTLDIKNNKEEP